MNPAVFFSCLFVMACVTYLVRMVPFVLVKKPVKSRFLRSFLYYIPFAVLTAMTIPAIFTATASLPSALAGFAVALILAFLDKGLIRVALFASAAALAVDLLLPLL